MERLGASVSLRGCFKSPLRCIKVNDPPFLVCPTGSNPPTLREAAERP